MKIKSKFSIWNKVINGTRCWGVNETRDYGTYTVGPHDGFYTRKEAVELLRSLRQKETNTYTVSNSFTGYKATIRVKGDGLPAISTLQKHYRKSKASDCESSTSFRDDQTGEHLMIVNMGKGLEVIRV